MNRPLVLGLVFDCLHCLFVHLWGTTITVIDGYSRANNETMRLLFGRKEASQKGLMFGWSLHLLLGFIIVLLFAGDVATLMRFATIASFLTTPVYAYLNYSLVNNKEHKLSVWLNWLSIFWFELSGWFCYFLPGLYNWSTQLITRGTFRVSFNF